MEFEYVVVRRKGVIVLPKKLRERLGLEEGDVLRVEVERDRIMIRKDDFWSKLLGSARGLYNPDEAELELDQGETG